MASVAEMLNSRTIVFNVALTLILVGLLALNYQQEKLAREDIVNTQGRPPAIGSQVPEFYVRSESGAVVKFQDLPQQDTLLVLWYLGCEPSYPVRYCEYDGGVDVPGFAASGVWSFLKGL